MIRNLTSYLLGYGVIMQVYDVCELILHCAGRTEIRVAFRFIDLQ